MPKRLLRRLLPKQASIGRYRWLGPLVERLREPGLWHMGRRSVTRATGIGLFVAFLPVPQILTISVLVILLRANLPVALAMIMVTNPLTMAPAFYMNYMVGTWLLRTPPLTPPDELSIGWIVGQLGSIWLPLWLGSVVVGALTGLAGIIVTHYGWLGYVRYRRKYKPHLTTTGRSDRT
jgi:uncharacterized protein (DUF2062 family)